MQDYRAWLLSFSIIAILLIVRVVLLKVLRLDIKQLLWLAPRGLITVLLALTAMETIDIGNFPQGAVMLTVLSSCLLVLLARPKSAKDVPFQEASRMDALDELDEIAEPDIKPDKAADTV